MIEFGASHRSRHCSNVRQTNLLSTSLMKRTAHSVILTLLGLHLCVYAQAASPEDELLTRAKNGESWAQAKLSIQYKYGKGRPKNEKEAWRWLKAAAEQGHVVAQARVGLCYRTGNLVEVNSEEAFKWTKRSAENGFFVAQIALGNCYRTGDGVQKDNVRAYMWYDVFVANGDFNETGSKNISEITKEMTQEEIAEARRLSAEWQKTQANKPDMATPNQPPE